MAAPKLPHRLGIRREDKSRWERRVPLAPAQVAALVRDHGIACTVEPSPIRIFPDREYAVAGARIDEDLGPCPVVLALKEIPAEKLRPDTTYLFFSHTIKGQTHNLPMLRRLLELGCQLIDYERMVDDEGRRLLFFGRHAGLAGMIDTLWTLGQRLTREGLATPFEAIRPAHAYADLDAARAAVTAAGAAIAAGGLPAAVAPLVVGFAGYGHVSLGAQEIFDLLPHRVVAPEALGHLPPGGPLWKVVFREEHTVEPLEPGAAFELADYRARPERYRSSFARHLPHLTVLVNGIYWESSNPRLVTCAELGALAGASSGLRLRVIGDISCDLNGAIECTIKATKQDDPVYTYDPLAGTTTDGIHAPGVAILAVDNLPAELPRDASIAFGDLLMPFVPALLRADFSVPFAELDLPAPLKRACIVHRGELTDGYRYLERYLRS
ncbi:MAG: hypothetical protein JXQ29_00685 [Planctomycetes bacterium]|nr:hypothetical protein [Planctomycetota bacterium]